MNHGFVDWLTATGANMYHDIHFAFNLPMFRGSHNVNDADLRDKGVTRIYDILFDYEDVLMETDRRLREILVRPEFQKEMGTREFYHHLGKILDEHEEEKQSRPGKRSCCRLQKRHTGFYIFAGRFHNRNERRRHRTFGRSLRLA